MQQAIPAIKKYFSFLFLVLLFVECKKNDTPPSPDVVISDFQPKEGSVRDRLFIYGENLLLDPSQIEVTIGDRKLKVVGVNEGEIYCFIPRQTQSGKVEVKIFDLDGILLTSKIFPKEFAYTTTSSVGTLVGKEDELGNAAIVDGDFDEAEFDHISWLEYDSVDNNLFVVEREKAVRMVDLDEETVTTLFTQGQASFSHLQTISFSSDMDTMFVVDDNGRQDENAVAIAYALRMENFRQVHPYLYDITAYSCVSNPVDHTMFVNTWWFAAIRKVITDPDTGQRKGEELFKMGQGFELDFKTTIVFHPSGDYAYILKESAIYRSEYNWETKELEPPIVFAGDPSAAGDVDATGTNARFNGIYQGTFVRNPSYEGQKDEYDFYVTDSDNHSVKIVTPQGNVTTYAGKGSPSSDGNVWGYIDGALRKDARFNYPRGIAYDPENNIFYVGDQRNHRIRTISIQ